MFLRKILALQNKPQKVQLEKISQKPVSKTCWNNMKKVSAKQKIKNRKRFQDLTFQIKC